MGNVWLYDLADVLRAAGLQVLEYDDWQERSRSSGGYDPGKPTHVMVHHTASPPSWSGRPDAGYCAEGDEDAPLSNLYLDRAGLWWVLAAGATNTNGKGSDWWGGGVPDDDMNKHAIGIEANGGYGDEWPKIQQDAYITGVHALCTRYRIPTNNVRGHFEWAPDRKVDPAGPSKWAPDSRSWDMDGFRFDVAALTGDTEEEDMPLTDEDVERIATKVWEHIVDMDPDDDTVRDRPAWWLLRQTKINVDKLLKR